MIAIALLYFKCKSYMAIIKHKETVFLEIQECVYLEGFQNQVTISLAYRYYIQLWG